MLVVIHFIYTHLLTQQAPKYSYENMNQAIQAVKDNLYTTTEAARVFDVPRQTLHDKVKSKYSNGRAGTPTLLKEAEEDALVGYATYMADHAIPITRTHLKEFIKELIKMF